MKFLLSALLLAGLALVPDRATACSRSISMRAFVADQREFERTHEFPLGLVVPVPVVHVVSVRRATSTLVGDCDVYAWVDLEISLPANSAFSLSELGMVFRSESGKPQDPFIAFPNFPVSSVSTTADGKVARFRFGLNDPPANRKDPFALKLEVFAIDRDLQVGASTTVSITHP